MAVCGAQEYVVGCDQLRRGGFSGPGRRHAEPGLGVVQPGMAWARGFGGLWHGVGSLSWLAADVGCDPC